MYLCSPYLYEAVQQTLRERQQQAAEHRLVASLRPRRRTRILRLLARAVAHHPPSTPPARHPIAAV